MGCDIHSQVELYRDGAWVPFTERIFPMQMVWGGNTHSQEPFDVRNYGMFGFLANVRDYSHVPPLSDPRGLPDDANADWKSRREDGYYHSFSWFLLSELLAFDYDSTFEDLRYFDGRSGAAIHEPGSGEIVTFRKFLGDPFFRDLEIMKGLGDPTLTRVLICFDS